MIKTIIITWTALSTLMMGLVMGSREPISEDEREYEDAAQLRAIEEWQLFDEMRS